MIVVLTDEAVADLERIGDFIAMDNPMRAKRFVEELVARCDRLALAPHAFPLMRNARHTDVRRRPYRDYLIFYRAETDRIVILHVLNGAQDYEPIVFPDP